MATQTTVINETTPGKSWSVFWELWGTPAQTIAGTLTANATFTCGEKVYKVVFNFQLAALYLRSFGKPSCQNEGNLVLIFQTTKGNDKINGQQFYIYFKIQLLQVTINQVRWLPFSTKAKDKTAY